MSYVTIAERVYTQQGLKMGIEQGIEQGQANLLLRQIERRFGEQAADIHEKVRSATNAQLEVWSLNILDAQVLEDVFKGC
ncbi:DUF4351 domain-containing protein [Castellaniella hirudinis]|uniref:DUF4351 domain-containing protein n=1 Tax=Castellaniella hirudinis TaxID=1144617 RepID=UPI0039C41A33